VTNSFILILYILLLFLSQSGLYDLRKMSVRETE
jgi:hypothetical protein